MSSDSIGTVMNELPIGKEHKPAKINVEAVRLTLSEAEYVATDGLGQKVHKLSQTETSQINPALRAP